MANYGGGYPAGYAGNYAIGNPNVAPLNTISTVVAPGFNAPQINPASLGSNVVWGQERSVPIPGVGQEAYLGGGNPSAFGGQVQWGQSNVLIPSQNGQYLPGGLPPGYTPGFN